MRTRKTSQLFVLTGILAIAAGLSACKVDDPGMRIAAVTPEPVQQNKLVHIHGSLFDEFVEGQSGITINGTCADIASWSDKRIDVLVPPGIGVGVRELRVFRADGVTVANDITINGPNLPPPEEERACAFNPGIAGGGGNPTDVGRPDGASDGGGDGIGPRDGRVDTGLPPDIGFPDVSPTCPIMIQEGACTEQADCDVLRDLGFDRMRNEAFNCGVGCIAEPQPEECIAECTTQSVGISKDCGQCWGALANCTILFCLAECIADPGNDACLECNRDSCGFDFEECTGVPYDYQATGSANRYVRIQDFDGIGDGAEIDAVVHFQGRSESYAIDVPRATPGSNQPSDATPSDMLGYPDAYFDYPFFELCQYFGAYPLGALGSAVIEMENEILPGDQLQILELGGECFLVDGSGEVAFTEFIEISIGPTPDGPWTFVGLTGGPYEPVFVP